MKKKYDLIVTLILPLLAGLASVWLEANFLLSTILFLAIPLVYLVARAPWIAVKRTAVFSLIVFAPLILMVDYIAVTNNVWLIPESLFSFKILGAVIPEMLLFTFLIMMYMPLWYDYFVSPTDVVFDSKRLKNTGIILWSILLFFVAIVWSASHLLIFPYAFFTLALVFGILPVVLFFFRYGSFERVGKLVTVSLYFAFFLLVYEFVALGLGQWIFPGPGFIGMVTLVGYTFPFEEFFFYIGMFAPVFIIYYEFTLKKRL